MIHFDFCFDYPDYRVQMGGNIASGECVGLMGPSGAGKSTLLRLLAGLETASKGQMFVDGVVWFDAKQQVFLPAHKRSIGMVFQNYALFPHMTVREQIIYAAGNQSLSWVSELLDLIGLDKLSNRYPKELSGGQQQRVALARALARKPQLLLLDEPLSAMDITSREQLQSLLRTIHTRYLTHTMLVSHDIAEIFLLAHRVLLCEKGRLVKNISPRELFVKNKANGHFSLSAILLSKRANGTNWVLTLLIGQNILEVIIDEQKALNLTEGEAIVLTPALLKSYFKEADSRT
jgi:molybdate transport system ATP-binding protein